MSNNIVLTDMFSRFLQTIFTNFRCRSILKPPRVACFLLFSSLTVSAAEISYSNIAPILKSRCAMCHAGAVAPLGLQLDSLEALLKGSQNGAVVVKGDSSNSELVKRLKGLSLPRMPMTGPPFLTDDEITMFEQWIDNGLKPGLSSKNNEPISFETNTNKAGTDILDAELVEEQPDKTPVNNTSIAAPSSTDVETVEPTEAIDQTERVTVYADIAVTLATRCAKCHTENGLMGPAPEGYLLTSYASTISANDRVRVVPGKPLASELLRRVTGHARPRMPFDGPPFLTDAEIISIEQWIEDGARDSHGNAAPMPTGKRVRLHGTLNKRWSLDGLALVVAGSTRIDKNPGPGDYVRVRGRVRNDGKIVVDRITRR